MISLEGMEAVCVKSEPEWEGEDARGVSEAAARVQAGCLSLTHLEVKKEHDWESGAGARGVSEAAVRADLYKDHQVKDELVLGPELVQPPDVVFELQGRTQQKNQVIQPEEKKRETAAEQTTAVSHQVYSETNTDVGELLVGKHLPVNNTASHFTCNSCSHTFETKFMLLEHKETQHSLQCIDQKTNHTGEKPHKCGNCSYASARKTDFLVHERIHATEKPYKCTHCSYSCTRKVDLLIHERNHTGEKPYKCAHCSYASIRISNLHLHERKHTSEKPFKCAHCSYASVRKSNLLVHERTHIGEKPYKCSHCSYSCARKSNLEVHERTHSSEKPYKCAQCSYAASTKNYLLIHARTHTGDKPYKCSLCSYATSTKYYLQIHERKHTREKPFKCGNCSYAGTSKYCLLIHERRRHTTRKKKVSRRYMADSLEKSQS